ncbi:MAG: hypothetical protein ABIP74_02095 [Candidatus Saccharimonas sp.]
MTSSDPIPRTREDFSAETLAEKAAQAVREAQQSHLAIVDLLEQAYGLDIDALTAIYGMDVLDGTKQGSRETLQHWRQLYEALGSKDKYLAVAHSNKETEPGCYGFGAKARYKSSTRLSVFKDAASTQVVTELDDEGKPRIVLRGMAAVRDYPQHDDEYIPFLKSYQMQDVMLAGWDEDSRYPHNHLGITVHGKSLLAVYDGLSDYHPYDGYSQMRDSAMNSLFNSARGR